MPASNGCYGNTYLNQLWQILKEALFIDGQFVVFIDNAVMFHLVCWAHTESVVAREVIALTDKEQSLLLGLQYVLRLLSLHLTMKPTKNHSLAYNIQNQTHSQ